MSALCFLRMKKLRLAFLAAIAVLPSFLKKAVLRAVFGFRIGRGVKIGFSLLDCGELVIGDGTTIGHFNLFLGVKTCEIGDHCRIGAFNLFRGGDAIRLERYCEVIRFNQVNAIIEPLLVTKAEPVFRLGAGSVLAASHKIDFTGGVDIGKRVVVGGRLTTLWTHNRQIAKPVSIGDFAYLGSDVKIAPGADIPSRCVVGMGSVVTKALVGENTLFAGVPAKAVKELDSDGIFLIENKTRPDLPDDV